MCHRQQSELAVVSPLILVITAKADLDLRILLIIGGFGIGGIVVPASIITTIICPDDLIATIAALTLSIRVIGGAVGYAVYYNVSSIVALAV